jgi:hypothetical protein
MRSMVAFSASERMARSRAFFRISRPIRSFA